MRTWITKLTMAGMAGAALLKAESALQGRVTDPAGAPVAESTVILGEERRGLAVRTATGEQGDYRFENLSPGLYTVRITKPGFQAQQHLVDIPKNGSPVTLNGQFKLSSAARVLVRPDNEEQVAPGPDLRPFLRPLSKPAWAHVRLLGRFDFTAAPQSSDGAPWWRQAAEEAYRRPPQLALVFGTTPQSPAAVGWRFRF